MQSKSHDPHLLTLTLPLASLQAGDTEDHHACIKLSLRIFLLEKATASAALS